MKKLLSVPQGDLGWPNRHALSLSCGIYEDCIRAYINHTNNNVFMAQKPHSHVNEADRSPKLEVEGLGTGAQMYHQLNKNPLQKLQIATEKSQTIFSSILLCFQLDKSDKKLRSPSGNHCAMRPQSGEDLEAGGTAATQYIIAKGLGHYQAPSPSSSVLWDLLMKLENKPFDGTALLLGEVQSFGSVLALSVHNVGHYISG
ncbi:hypothetical protein B0T20DRAFT_392139 [Sordaria brevicollis]|uniref:Uncharacterized protein n=1 Tax=Sordaria brevicollis TaxID=83679 RepID=A0AAE0PFN1_SORBR|nr:hypothetical protein B0T20DRAFT_392139 [Sordaria brevicollis]